VADVALAYTLVGTVGRVKRLFFMHDTLYTYLEAYFPPSIRPGNHITTVIYCAHIVASDRCGGVEGGMCSMDINQEHNDETNTVGTVQE